MSVIEVTQLLKKLKRKKAAENDDLPPGLLNDSAAVISAPLTPIIIFHFGWVYFLLTGKLLNLYIDYLSESKLLSKGQFGFCGRRSTELAVTLLCDDIYKNADFKLLTGCGNSARFDNHLRIQHGCGIRQYTRI